MGNSRIAAAAGAATAIIGALVLSMLAPGKAQAADGLPKFEAVAAQVQKHFEKLPGWKPGHIISRADVKPLFASLAGLGWKVADEKALLEKLPADGDYVLKELQTNAGRKFMDQISKYPLAYDRLYRLAALPRGKQMVHDLVHQKGGYKMIEYMTTADGGKELGKMLSKAPKGANFNDQLGKLFTQDDLLAELRKSYDAARAQK